MCPPFTRPATTRHHRPTRPARSTSPSHSNGPLWRTVPKCRLTSYDPVLGTHTVPRRFERQADVDEIVRAYYLESLGTTPEPVDLDMSSPHMRAAAAELGFPLGEDGRLGDC